MKILKIFLDTASDKIFCAKAFNIAKNPKYDRYQRSLALMVYKFFDKKSSSSKTSGGAVTQQINLPIKAKLCQTNLS